MVLSAAAWMNEMKNEAIYREKEMYRLDDFDAVDVSMVSESLCMGSLGNERIDKKIGFE